jgi:uncharacterized protein YndB with AHSA1/START domain/DNA-binding transcriptional ArsR family regulator
VAEPARRAILDLLSDGPLPVTAIAGQAGLSQPNASRHLRILRETGLVLVKPQAQRRLYELRPQGLVELDSWLAPYRDLWRGGLDDLENHLDESEWTMPEADAVLQDDRGRSVLRFERSLPYPPDRVWRALTESDELAAWHPSPFELEPRVGGLISYVKGDNWPEIPDGEVTEYEPPRLLAYTWGEDDLHWELRPREDGCLLILSHTFNDRFKSARDAAGWQICLTALSTSLDPEQPGAKPNSGRPSPEWSELNSLYEERFGIPPDKATPPPKPWKPVAVTGVTEVVSLALVNFSDSITLPLALIEKRPEHDVLARAERHPRGMTALEPCGEKTISRSSVVLVA